MDQCAPGLLRILPCLKRFCVTLFAPGKIPLRLSQGCLGRCMGVGLLAVVLGLTPGRRQGAGQVCRGKGQGPGQLGQ